MAQRPAVVAFDVVETLFSLSPVGRRFQSLDLSVQTFGLWFARVLRDGFALAACDDYRPFDEVAAAQLELLLYEQDVETSRGQISRVFEAFSQLDPTPDAGPALQMLHDAEIPVVLVTNASADTTGTLLRRAGLDRLVEHVVSADEVKRWKPHPAPYLRAAEVAGVEPSQLALVSVHAWDVMGAGKAGLVTGWASRLDGIFPAPMGGPTVSGASLTQVVDGLLGLPAGREAPIHHI